MKEVAYKAIDKHEHRGALWHGGGFPQFAAQHLLAPLVSAELAKVATVFPIVFASQGDGFMPAALMGLRTGVNLFMESDGRWIGSYMPAVLRTYPFALLSAKPEEFTFCVDEAAVLAPETSLAALGGAPAERLFDDQGELTPRAQLSFTLLTQLQSGRGPTEAACAKLREHEVIVPLELSYQTKQGTRRIEGLFKVDEEKLQNLDDEAFLDLRSSGAFVIAFTHLISLQHINTLKAMDQERQTREAVAQALKQPGEMDLGFLSGDTLKLG